MIERFVDVFGLEVKISSKTRSDRQYSISTPECYTDFLEDIDHCLERRAMALIEEMREVSLSVIASEAEKAKATAEANQVELSRKILEVQLSHTDSDLVAGFSSSYIYPGKTCHQLEEDWNQPEVIEDMRNLLYLCQTVGELSDLRSYTQAPAWVFKQAASQLEATKRQQIKHWVLEDNETRSIAS